MARGKRRRDSTLQALRKLLRDLIDEFDDPLGIINLLGLLLLFVYCVKGWLPDGVIYHRIDGGWQIRFTTTAKARERVIDAVLLVLYGLGCPYAYGLWKRSKNHSR